jgi:uncharacterized membrane protein YeaQ/YmgE (transglycosylase-associated protein family)
MSILAWMGVGILAGWLAEKITRSDHGLITNLIVGVIGAFIGGFLMTRCSATASTRASTLPRSWWRRSARWRFS